MGGILLDYNKTVLLYLSTSCGHSGSMSLSVREGVH